MKFLRQSSQDSMAIQSTNAKEESKSERTNEENEELDLETPISIPIRKAPQKWTASEKKIFLSTLEDHGE